MSFSRLSVPTTMLALALAGCNEHTVRFDHDSAPMISDDGVRIAVERYRESDAQVVIWLTITNTGAGDIHLTAPDGQASWVVARCAGEPAQVRAQRLRESPAGDPSAPTAEPLSGDVLVPAQRSERFELTCTLPQPRESNHEPWTVAISAMTPAKHVYQLPIGQGDPSGTVAIHAELP